MSCRGRSTFQCFLVAMTRVMFELLYNVLGRPRKNPSCLVKTSIPLTCSMLSACMALLSIEFNVSPKRSFDTSRGLHGQLLCCDPTKNVVTRISLWGSVGNTSAVRVLCGLCRHVSGTLAASPMAETHDKHPLLFQ